MFFIVLFKLDSLFNAKDIFLNNFVQIKLIILFIIVIIIPDYVSCLSGPFKEHDLPMRSRYVPDVRRPDVGVSDMPEGSRQAYFTLLDKRQENKQTNKKINKYICTQKKKVEWHIIIKS